MSSNEFKLTVTFLIDRFKKRFSSVYLWFKVLAEANVKKMTKNMGFFRTVIIHTNSYDYLYVIRKTCYLLPIFL